MFIREIIKKNPGYAKPFIYHRLIEAVRTPKGPRQSVLLNLGTLEIPREEWKTLAEGEIYVLLYDAREEQLWLAEPGVPESFNVLIRELQSLCLDVELMKKPKDVPDLAHAAD